MTAQRQITVDMVDQEERDDLYVGYIGRQKTERAPGKVGRWWVLNRAVLQRQKGLQSWSGR